MKRNELPSKKGIKLEKKNNNYGFHYINYLIYSGDSL